MSVGSAAILVANALACPFVSQGKQDAGATSSQPHIPSTFVFHNPAHVLLCMLTPPPV